MRFPWQKQSEPTPELNSTYLAEAVMQIPEIAEAFSQAEIELLIDDQGWTGGVPYMNAEYDARQQGVVLQRARRYWRDDPLAKQAVRLWTDYTFGATGICYDTDDEKLKGELDAIFQYPKNKKLLNAQGQQRLSKKLLVEGDVFFLIFDTPDVATIRTMDPEQMAKILTDPDDEETVLGYRRKVKNSGDYLYYRDWTNEDETTVKDPDTTKEITWEADVVCYHVAFDQFGKRGNGLLNCVIDWSGEHRRFMHARVAILQALSKYATKTTIKGGQATLNAVQARLQSSLVTTGASQQERNPKVAPGSNLLQNAGFNLEAMPRKTEAGDAKGDSDSLKLMVCAGTGIFLHYFGDPSTGNLATATAMELPMMKQFIGNQQLWKDAYRDLFQIATKREAKDLSGLKIDLPPVLEQDIAKLAAFITSITTAFPEAKVPAVLSTALDAMGVEDLDNVMDDIEAKKVENDAALPKPGALPGAPQPTQTPEQLAKAQESFDQLTAAVTKLTTQL